MTRKIVLIVLLATGALAVGLGLASNHSYVTTPSMYPTIPPGSEVVVRHEPRYHVGEVIEFHANGITWAHRLIAIRPDGSFLTKGDNPQNAPDVFVPSVTAADVVGAVIHAPRWVGFPELIAHHPAYGLSWLRTELGVPGKILLVGLAAIASFFFASAGAATRSTRRRHARHHRRAQPSF